jgi:hypothetical protein
LKHEEKESRQQENGREDGGTGHISPPTDPVPCFRRENDKTSCDHDGIAKIGQDINRHKQCGSCHPRSCQGKGDRTEKLPSRGSKVSSGILKAWRDGLQNPLHDERCQRKEGNGLGKPQAVPSDDVVADAKQGVTDQPVPSEHENVAESHHKRG